MNGPAVRPRGIAARSKRGRIGSGSSSQRELPRLPSLRPITQVIHLGELRRCAQENCGYCRTFCIMFSGRCGWLIALTLTVNGNRWLGIIRSSRAPRGGLGGAH